MAQQAAEITQLLQETAAQRAQITQLQQEKATQHESSDVLLLRELATPTVAKVVRKATGCSVWEARRTPLCAIKDDEVYHETMKQYPKLKVALKAACSQARSVAHPVPEPPPDEQSLRELIQRAAPVLVRPAAEQLLACLVQLSAEFDEPLFVKAEPPN